MPARKPKGKDGDRVAPKRPKQRIKSMFKINERLNNGTKLIASFTTFDEAERYVLEHKVVCYERDADHPGCADVFLADGRLWSIDAPTTTPGETNAGTSPADDGEGYRRRARMPPATNGRGSRNRNAVSASTAEPTATPE